MSEKEKKQPTGDYPFGYARPPQHSKWPKGTSGNPKGRTKKGSINVTDILAEDIVVTRAGVRRKMQPFEVNVRALVKKAIEEKNLNAIMAFLDLCEKYDVIKPPAPEQSGGVIFAPKGITPQEWIMRVTEPIPPTPEDHDDR